MTEGRRRTPGRGREDGPVPAFAPAPPLPWRPPPLCCALTLPAPPTPFFIQQRSKAPPSQRERIAAGAGCQVLAAQGPAQCPFMLAACPPACPAARAARPRPLSNTAFPVDLAITVRGRGREAPEAGPGTQSERAGAPGPAAAAVVTVPLRGPRDRLPGRASTAGGSGSACLLVGALLVGDSILKRGLGGGVRSWDAGAQRQPRHQARGMNKADTQKKGKPWG